MAYVATRGGERAIEQSERLFRAEMGEITPNRVTEIRTAMPYLVDRVMGESSLYDEDLAALALAQTGGELYEAVLLLRAWRTTQPRLTVAEPVTQESLFTHRRISAAFKDIPGGQVLGPTLDYAHRILATGRVNTLHNRLPVRSGRGLDHQLGSLYAKRARVSVYSPRWCPSIGYRRRCALIKMS